MGGSQGNPSSSRSQPPMSPEKKVFVTAVDLPDWKSGSRSRRAVTSWGTRIRSHHRAVKGSVAFAS